MQSYYIDAKLLHQATSLYNVWICV